MVSFTCTNISSGIRALMIKHPNISIGRNLFDQNSIDPTFGSKHILTCKYPWLLFFVDLSKNQYQTSNILNQICHFSYLLQIYINDVMVKV